METNVFVVMPFGRKEVKPAIPPDKDPPGKPAVYVNFNEVYEMLISPALKKAHCKPFRGDEERGAGDIRTDMFYELVTADVVLADISILNPNVFYELGIRHGVAPRGVLMIRGGWQNRPFDVITDRAFDYDGSLFEQPRNERDDQWNKKLEMEIGALSRTIKNALDEDDQKIGSPVYKELTGLRPVDWTGITAGKAKYFGNVFVNLKNRVEVAKLNQYPGDILTLAQEAPTRSLRIQLLWEAARTLIQMFRFEPALTLLDQLLSLEPDDMNALAQKGLVLGRLKRSPEARVHMARVVERFAGNPEVQGILGRIYKDRWRLEWESTDELARRQQLAASNSATTVSAIRSYEAAFRKNLDSYYNGINIVSLSRLLDFLKTIDEESEDSGTRNINDVMAVVRLAATMALKVAEGSNKHGDAAWAAATLAELELAAGDGKKCKSLYRKALNTPEIQYFMIDSMLSQVRIFELLGFRPELVPEVISIFEDKLSNMKKPQFQFDKIFICSGHMIDTPNRKFPRFPSEKEKTVRSEMRRILNSWGIGKGDLAICGGACGSDILFAELCIEMQAEVRIYVPLEQGDFLDKSFRLPNSDWEERFFDLQKKAEFFYQYQRFGAPPSGTSAFSRNNLWMINTGLVEAQQASKLHALLVWDEESTDDGPGGTYDFAKRVVKLGTRKKIINPTTL